MSTSEYFDTFVRNSKCVFSQDSFNESRVLLCRQIDGQTWWLSWLLFALRKH